jgi:hypothetical protein
MDEGEWWSRELAGIPLFVCFVLTLFSVTFGQYLAFQARMMPALPFKLKVHKKSVPIRPGKVNGHALSMKLLRQVSTT